MLWRLSPPPPAAAEGTDEEKQQQQKERHTVDGLRELTRSVRSGTFHYDGKPKRSLDWATYNEAQVNEMADTLNLIRKFVDRASARIPEKPRRGRGRPPFPARDVAKALLLQTYFGVSDRVAAGLVRLFKEKLGISEEFSYKTIERGYDPSHASEILREVFRLTNEHGNAKETVFSVDGTGEPTSSKINYESIRAEQRKKNEKEDKEKKKEPSGSSSSSSSSSSSPQSKEASLSSSSSLPLSSTTTTTTTAAAVAAAVMAMSVRHGYQLTAMSVGVHTKLYGGFATTGDRSVGEFSFFPSLVSQTHNNCPAMETILGDPLYANRVACAIAAAHGATPYFLPRSNSTFLSLGVPSWNNMTHAFVEDPQRWLEAYHDRSISETANSMDKNAFPERIRRRLPHRKDAVSALRRYVHNIRRYGYMEHLQPEMLKLLPS
jgi:transposase